MASPVFMIGEFALSAGASLVDGSTETQASLPEVRQAYYKDKPLLISSMSIGIKSVQCDIRVNPECLRASDELLDLLIELMPSLPDHACASGGIGVFADKMKGTSLPHLVEHVAIDLLVRTYQPEEIGFAGNTVWLDRSVNLMSVRVSYQDSWVTEAALYAATELINQIMTEDNPDHDFPVCHHPSPCIMAILQDLQARRRN